MNLSLKLTLACALVSELSWFLGQLSSLASALVKPGELGKFNCSPPHPQTLLDVAIAPKAVVRNLPLI